MLVESGSIESRDDFEKNPRGQYSFWHEELKGSLKSRRNWHKQGDKIVKRFLDSRSNVEGIGSNHFVPFRLNLFHSSVTTLTSMLYGNLPKVDVSRRFADPNDDIARVAAEMLERLLNRDIASNGEKYNAVLRSTLQDRLLPGLGCARVRYDVQTEQVEDPESGEKVEQVVSEDAPVEYLFWRDVTWSWGRSFSELDWIAFRSYLTKDEVKERFTEEVANDMEFKKQIVTDEESALEDDDKSSVWQKAEVWEVWDKIERKVIYIALGGPQKILETKADFLKLKQFFPCPPFFIANPTTSLYEPVPDYHMAQDLYNEIDKLQTRISVITEAVKVVGVYDASADGIQRMFKEGNDNTLIPIDNYALFGEKGGLQGQIDWLPLADIVGALEQLRTLRDETISLLHQVTGMADVIRGGGEGQYEGVGQAQLKAKFGSVRIQALQDEFARFASDLLQLKAEVIVKHFSPESIVKAANMQSSYDIDLIEPAVMLLKNPEEASMRVDIRPESVAMVDYAQLKAERTDYINALSMFMQSAKPLMELQPEAKPFLLQLLQWGLAGFKGASEIEGVIDKAIQQSEEEQKQPKEDKPDPAIQLQQMKDQAEMQKIQAKAQADQQAREFDMQADMQTAQMAHQAKMTEINANLQAKLAEVQAKLQSDMLMEQMETQANISQIEQGAEAELAKDAAGIQLEIQKEVAKTSLKIQEIAAATEQKIKEAKAKPLTTKKPPGGKS